MDALLAERALAALYELHFDLTRGGRRATSDSSVWRRSPSSSPTPARFSAQTSHANKAAISWESRQMRRWKFGRRLTADGVLRVRVEPVKPWTIRRVRAVWPQLGELDAVAVLVHLDGAVGRTFMDAHKNIREVVEQVADARLKQALLDPKTGELLREVVRAEVAALFAEVRAALTGTPVAPAGDRRRVMRCGKCRQPGHKATTCKAEAPAEPVVAA